VPLPVLRQQDAPQIGVAVEADAEHVVALALHPVRPAPYGGERGAGGDARAEPRAEGEREGRVEDARDLNAQVNELRMQKAGRPAGTLFLVKE